MSSTWLALYASCLCSEVAESPDALPATCPCHHRRMAVPPVPERPGTTGPMRLGHQCPNHDDQPTEPESTEAEGAEQKETEDA